MTENYFVELNTINVNEHVEQKNHLSYLSWAWAWRELKTRHPDARYTIYEDKNGLFYHTDGKTCWVKTGVTVNGLEHIEYLPVMDYKNKSIPLENVTSTDVNKAIQRSLTKAVARHGLGLYIYAGEDLPESEPSQQVQPEPSRQVPDKAFSGQLKQTIEEYKKLSGETNQKIFDRLLKTQGLDISKGLKGITDEQCIALHNQVVSWMTGEQNG